MDSITRYINVVTYNAPLASGTNVKKNVHNGLIAVGGLLSWVTGSPYPVRLSPNHDTETRRGVEPFPLSMCSEPPRVMLEILTTVAQRVFDQVARGEEEAAVLADATAEIDREFANIPGPSEQ